MLSRLKLLSYGIIQIIAPHMKLQIALWPLLLIPIASLLNISDEPAVREVFTGQQLFYVKLIPQKTNSKNKKVKFEAALRNAFKVIRYEADTSYVELDWTMCPDGKCPEIGQFVKGSSQYSKLDSIITLY